METNIKDLKTTTTIDSTDYLLVEKREGTRKISGTIFNSLKGEKGDKGDRGIQGERGLTGATGPQGPRGLQGEKGDKGEQGPVGPQGEIGPQGPRGADGLTTSIIVNGQTYNHNGGKITLPNYPTKTSQLTNDSNFATQSHVTSEINSAKNVVDKYIVEENRNQQIKIWIGTAEEYTSLSVKNENTLYFLK